MQDEADILIPFTLIDDYEQSPAWALYKAFDEQIKLVVALMDVAPHSLTLYASPMTLATIGSLWTDPTRQRAANAERAALGGFDFLLNGIGGYIDDTLPHGAIKVVMELVDQDSKMIDREWSITS